MSLLGLDVAVVFASLALFGILYKIAIRVPKGLRLPPGPPRHPILGNLKDLLTGEQEYVMYDKWAKKYGDLVYLNVLGQSMLILNSADMVQELFTKKGAVCSGRPRSVIFHQLTNFGNSSLMFMDDSDRMWTRQRAILQQVLTPKRVLSYHPLLEANARSFTQRLIAQPINDLKFTRNAIGGFIIQFTYGIEPLLKNDPYLEIADRVARCVTQVINPGAFQVEVFPIMRFLPSWFPGLEFPAMVKNINEGLQGVLHLPYEYAKKVFKEGNYRPSFVSGCLEDLANNPKSQKDAEEVISQIAMTLYLAGFDTIETTVQIFILTMTLYPDAQRKAQEEMDKVIGRESLPTFDDLPNLPYLNALFKELLRWQPVAPFGIPHTLRQEDTINGYFIPKGTICFGNSRFLLRSENDYGPDTHEFRPERFLDGSAKGKLEAAFGYGRRACPGRMLADHYLTILIATVLHVATISAPKDDPLTGIIKNQEFSSGALCRPREFRCQVDVRLPKIF